MTEETVRATLIILEARGLIEWPTHDLCEAILNDVTEMLKEEDYDEGQPDWYQEWHDFDPEA
jgi:hypothetical protein